MSCTSNILRTSLSKICRLAALLSILAMLPISVIAAPKNQPSNDFTVVIDAGHGGHDHGAIDNGAKEKDINLGVANQLASMIRKKMKDVRVVMTRDDDTFISLQERANIANRNRGNLFISIHTNSVDKSNPNRKSVKGTSVYALGLHKDQNNLKVAQRENSVIELESNYEQKYSGFDPSRDESYIIFEMAQKKNLGQSLKFANEAQKQLVKTAGRADRGVKQAGFWVLWATSMPAVLVELDFICNPEQAAYLNSESGQKELATALYNALDSYIDSQKAARSNAETIKTNSAPSTVKSQQSKPAQKSRDKAKNRRKAREKRNNKNDEAEVNESLISEEKTAASSRTDGGTVTLVSDRRDTKRIARGPATPARKSSATASRRRRSDSAKKASDSRIVETDNIQLLSENEFLAKTEEKASEVKQNVASQPEKASNKKGKKDKKSIKRKTDNKKKTAKPVTISKGSSNIVLADKDSKGKNTNVRKTKDGRNVYRIQSSKQIAAQQTATAKQRPATTVYKIQLCASEKELRSDDPAFQGLKPVKSFRENNLYKYTYGESESRKEIEKLLLEVKSIVPDAFIIVSRR